MFGLILSISLFYYIQAQNFFKDQLTKQLEHRLMAHAEAIENHFHIDTIIHVLKMEKEETVNFILFDENIIPLAVSKAIPPEVAIGYQQWISNTVSKEKLIDNHIPITEYIETEERSIPHIWSMQAIFVQGKIKGYLFIDQDTREFNQTRESLFQTILMMGGIISLLAVFFILYLTKVLTRPLQQMGRITHEIAKGQFDSKLDIQGKDEVSNLALDISDMAKQLKRYRDTRKEFLSHISHDLRTPLTYVKAYSSLLKDGAIKDDCKKHAEIIHQQATRMELLVADLFQLAKLEEGNIELQLEKVDIVGWLQSFKQSYSFKMEQEGILFELEFGRENIEFVLDKKRIEQVLINLVENSIRYTSRNGTISLSAGLYREQLVLTISDSGKGIPEEDVPFIWERFYRVDKSRSSAGGGSGLGLAIVKQIIDLHGGKIEVASIVGTGTTFTIMLPPTA